MTIRLYILQLLRYTYLQHFGLAALDNLCKKSTYEVPKQVLVHLAYGSLVHSSLVNIQAKILDHAPLYLACT